jgi:hypothetical protein
MGRIGAIACAFAGLVLAGCASSQELNARSEQQLQLAQAAAQSGDYKLAKKEQNHAFRLYQSAAVRSLEEGQPVPPAPPTPQPLPQRVTF